MDMEYVEKLTLTESLDELDNYLLQFTNMDSCKESMPIFFHIQKQKYFEALDIGNSQKAVVILRDELKRMHETMSEYLPRDVKIMKSLLKSMGVQDYEPRIVHQFLELWYRYVVDVLIDAQVYSEHAGKHGINSDDVKLAIQTKVNCSFS